MNALYSLIAKEALSKRLDELSQCLNIPARLLDAEGNQLEQHGETGAYCALLKARAFCDCVRTYLKAGRIACEPGESQVFSCHAGLNHIAFSLVRRKQLLGTVIVGPFRMDAPDSMPLSGLADKRRLTPPLCPDLYDELQKLPVITPARLHGISCLMDDLFTPLLSDARLLMRGRQEKLCRQPAVSDTVQHYKGTPTDSMCTLIYQKECALLGKVKQCDIQGARRVLNELLSFVLLAQGQDLQWIRRNIVHQDARLAPNLSPSAKRAWIEIRSALWAAAKAAVALCEEGVDRNFPFRLASRRSLGRPLRRGRG